MTNEEITLKAMKMAGVKTTPDLIAKIGKDNYNMLINTPTGQLTVEEATRVIGTPDSNTEVSPTTAPVNPYQTYGVDARNPNSTVTTQQASLGGTDALKLQYSNQLEARNNYVNQEGYNAVTGNEDFASTKGAFGTANSTGWVAPALQVGQGVFNGYMAYQGLQETKKNNERTYKLAKENERRQAIAYNNKVNEKKRYAGLLMGSGNSYGSTAGVIARTGYSKY
jgi:hypothetical protein